MFTLIAVLLLSLISLNAMENTLYNMRMTANAINYYRTVESAHAALYRAEQLLLDTEPNTAQQFSSQERSSWRALKQEGSWKNHSAVQVCEGMVANCYFLIERMGSAVSVLSRFRVTVQVQSSRGDTYLYMQCIYELELGTLERLSWQQLR